MLVLKLNHVSNKGPSSHIANCKHVCLTVSSAINVYMYGTIFCCCCFRVQYRFSVKDSRFRNVACFLHVKLLLLTDTSFPTHSFMILHPNRCTIHLSWNVSRISYGLKCDHSAPRITFSIFKSNPNEMQTSLTITEVSKMAYISFSSYFSPWSGGTYHVIMFADFVDWAGS